MSRPKSRALYAILDRLLGLGVVPDLALRLGARQAARQVLRRERAGGVEAEQRRLSELVALKGRGPVAIATEAANEQHYAIPPEFFGLFLGRRRKYSACLWPAATADLDQAEERMLELSGERAGLEDGQRVLDLGCGWGAMTLWIAERYPRSSVTAVSNSAPQGRWIAAEAERRGLSGRVEVVTADVNRLELPADSYDRVVSIEMFEHLANWAEMLRRIALWTRPDGRVFLHVFSHRTIAYPYAGTIGAERFFTGGLMPSHDLLLSFQRDLVLTRRWAIDGRHYARTLAAWLERLDRQRDAALGILGEHHGDRRRARLALANWRLFLIACAEMWGHRRGQEWIVSHYLLEPRG